MILSIGWIVLNACGPKEVEVETVKPIVETSVEIPTPTEAKPFVPPQPEVSDLNGGGQLWLLEDHDLPLVVFSIVLPGGSAQDPQDKLGQAELANQMLLEAAGGFTASEISNAFYELAADVSIQTTRQHSILQVSAHRDRLNDVLSYVSKMIFEPTFNDADWTRVQDMHLAGLKQSRQDSSWVASQYTGYFLYGADHPLGRAVRGTPKTISALSKTEAMQWHQDRLKGASAQLGIVAVGDLDQATV
jgi:zinc protease